MRAILVLLLVFVASNVYAQPREVTLAEVLQVALSRPALRSQRALAKAEENRSKATRGGLLPTLAASAEFQHWNEPFDVKFTVPGGTTLPFRARDQNTSSLGISLSQPVSGLWRRYEEYSAETSAAAAALAGVTVTEAAQREALEIEYLRMFEARALAEIAESSETELIARFEAIQAEAQAGLVTDADVLRVQVALAASRRRGAAAKSEERVRRAHLLAAMGLPPAHAGIVFAEPKALLNADPRPSEAPATTAQERPEVLRARHEAEAAQHRARSKVFALLPEVDLVGGYSRATGQLLAPKNAAFVGIRANWVVWDFGAHYYAERAASAEAQAKQFELQATRQQTELDAAVAREELASASDAVTLAEQALKSAEEVSRVSAHLVKAELGTVSDLLAAQSGLVDARLSLLQARYERSVYRVRLEHVLGTRSPLASERTPTQSAWGEPGRSRAPQAQ